MSNISWRNKTEEMFSYGVSENKCSVLHLKACSEVKKQNFYFSIITLLQEGQRSKMALTSLPQPHSPKKSQYGKYSIKFFRQSTENSRP